MSASSALTSPKGTNSNLTQQQHRPHSFDAHGTHHGSKSTNFTVRILPAAFDHNSSMAHAVSLRGPSEECKVLFNGGASDPIEQGLSVGLSVLSKLPQIGDAVKWLGSLVDFIKPKALVTGQSVYNCLSGFVEEAIKKGIDEYDLHLVNGDMDTVKWEIESLQQYMASPHSNPTEIAEDFKTILSTQESSLSNSSTRTLQTPSETQPAPCPPL